MTENFSIQTEGAKTYLVYSVGADEEIDTISLGMLTNNRIEGFADTIFSQMDAQKYIKYDVSSKVALEQVFSGVVTRKRLLGAFIGILDAVNSAEEYMIDTSMIVLDFKYIFMDIATGSTVVICVPISNVRSSVDLGNYFKSIMFRTQFDQDEDCGYVARIINYLNSTPNMIPADFQKLLGELNKAPKPVQTEPAAQQSAAVKNASQKVPQNLALNCEPIAPAPVSAIPKSVAPQSEPVQSISAFTSQEPAAQPTAEGNGDKMSMLYLLRHYSKENAEIYKAQQKSKGVKGTGIAAQDAPSVTASATQKTDKKGKKKKTRQNEVGNIGFAMPNQPTQPSSVAQPAPKLVEQPAPQPVARQSIPQAQPAIQINTVSQSSATPAQVTSDPAPYKAAAVAYVAPDEETSFLEESEETVIMGQESIGQRLTPHLVRKKNNERIPIDKEIFRLGRDVEFNDYAIIDNRFVGHSHCHIVTRDGEYFIVDDNSKNHTKVNGAQITPGTEVKLVHDYVVSVADEEFEFKLF